MRLLPEYSPVKSILLALPYAGGDWDANLSAALECYTDMVEAFIRSDNAINILLLTQPRSRVENWVSGLALTEKQLQQLQVIRDIAYDDTWVRDFGPLSFNEKGQPQSATCYKTFTFNGWGNKYAYSADDKVSQQLIRYGIGPHLKLNLVVEGGGIEINNAGQLLLNKDCIVTDTRNPNVDMAALEARIKSDLGSGEILWLENIQLTGDDTDGHIDTFARFLNDHTIVACEANTEHHDAESLERLNQQLTNICEQKGWTLAGLPVPVIHSQVDNRILPATYANFLHCNNTLYVPIYGVAEDEKAIAVLQSLAPEKTIVAIRCEALLEQHGSLHCATMQIAR
jgi:Peptidylarginine deiminase and related enzymes